MRDLYLVEVATRQQAFIAPVKLERITLPKTKWHEGFTGQFARLLTPCANEVAHHAVATPVAQSLDLLEQRASSASAMFRGALSPAALSHFLTIARDNPVAFASEQWVSLSRSFMRLTLPTIFMVITV
ncbi:hypothetical protein EXZ61_17240 [Rhodoferax aquaticus]|uniref:Uncharacterized protein n=1 Tax=Rhodoferax aquaticus TaxID=2527691 RepID=A0A515ESX2_9BURK|nr:hypothetical protein EXZ61_17240 [Rhodoferax aquaticus]